MKFITLLLLALSSVAQGQPVDLKGKAMVFTNLQGRAYTNVTLNRADTTGVFFTSHEGAMGFVHYTNLSADTITALGAPSNRITWAKTIVDAEKAKAELRSKQAAAVAYHMETNAYNAGFNAGYQDGGLGGFETAFGIGSVPSKSELQEAAENSVNGMMIVYSTGLRGKSPIPAPYKNAKPEVKERYIEGFKAGYQQVYKDMRDQHGRKAF